MLLRGDMTKRAEKWPIIGWWWHHPVMTIGREGVWVCSPTKLKQEPRRGWNRAVKNTATYTVRLRAMRNTKNQSGYEPLNLENGSFVNSDNFDATDWNCWEIAQNPTVREYTSRCNSVENIHIHKVIGPWDRVIFVGETEAIIAELRRPQGPPSGAP